MAPNHNFSFVATSADTSVNQRNNEIHQKKQCSSIDNNDQSHQEEDAGNSFKDSKPQATIPSATTSLATISHVASAQEPCTTTVSDIFRDNKDDYLFMNSKRRLPSSVNISEPDTEAGLELLFAASLIQQKGESSKQPSSKTISSCSENDSTMGDSPSHTPAEFSEFPEVLEPSDRDVLMGRGGRVNKHVGNIVYRKVVDYNKAIYKQVPKRHRILVSQSIVQTIEKHGGRFLQHVTGHGNRRQQTWKCIQFRRAVQKTSQALREPMNESADPSATSASLTGEISK